MSITNYYPNYPDTSRGGMVSGLETCISRPDALLVLFVGVTTGTFTRDA